MNGQADINQSLLNPLTKRGNPASQLKNTLDFGVKTIWG